MNTKQRKKELATGLMGRNSWNKHRGYCPGAFGGKLKSSTRKNNVKS